MGRLKAALAFSIVVLGALLSACGGSSNGSQHGSATSSATSSAISSPSQGDPKQAATAFLAAVAAGDANEACDLLSDAGKRSIVGSTGSCPAAIRTALVNGGFLSQVTVGRVITNGDRATAIVVPKPGSAVQVTVDALDLARINGRWLVSGSHKSSQAERGGKTGREILNCLSHAGVGTVDYGGDPQAISIGQNDDAELIVFHVPEQAAAGLAQRKSEFPHGIKLVGNVIVGYRTSVDARVRGKVEGCA